MNSPHHPVIPIADFIKSGEPSIAIQARLVFDDIPTQGEAELQVIVNRETAGLGLKGHLYANVQQECYRCLTEFVRPVMIPIDEKYAFSQYVEYTSREMELGPEDFYEVVDEQGELDLHDLAHQLLILELADQGTCGQSECTFIQAPSQP